MKLYRKQDKIFKLKILRLSEAYTALTDPRKRPEDDFETEDEWDEMWRDLKKAHEAKQEGERHREKEEEGEGGEKDQESKDQEEGETGDSTNQTNTDENDLPSGTPEEEVYFKKSKLLKLAKKGQWGDSIVPTQQTGWCIVEC